MLLFQVMDSRFVALLETVPYRSNIAGLELIMYIKILDFYWLRAVQ